MAVSSHRTTRWITRASLGVGGAGAIACGGATDPSLPPPNYTVVRLTGDGQTGPAFSELALPLEVEVREPSGQLAKGVAVRFRLTSGRGTLTDTLVATGLDGIGRTRLRLGDRDSVVVAAAVRGQEDRGTTFRAGTTSAVIVEGVTPSRFNGGDTVVVRGGRFVADARGTDVLFGAVRGRIVGGVGSGELRVVVPPCLPAGDVAVRVRTAGLLTNAVAATADGADAPLTLGTGEGVVLRGAESGCLRLAVEGQRVLIVPQYAAVGTTPTTSAPFALAVASLSSGALVADPFAVLAADQRTTRMSFEATLRAREHALAGEIAGDADAVDPGAVPGPTSLRAPRAPSWSRAAAPPPPPALGTTRTFHVLSNLSGTNYATVTARLRFAGDNILFYDDVTQPAPLTDDEVRRLGGVFDGTLYRLDVATFGAESDIDGNGRVIVLTTPIVNAITPASECAANGFIPGFFFGSDLSTRTTNSNRAEIFYAYVPDPRAERSCAHRVDDVLGLLPATFAHEFQHMISFNQHVLVRRGADEATWLNEGLSHIAEELGARYYDERYPAPGGRTIAAQMLPDSAVSMLRGDLTNAAAYLANPGAHSVTTFQSLGTLEERGASWLFLRWLGAQKGDAIYGRLVQTGLTSRANVEAVAGETLETLLGDFSLALYADSIPGLPRSAVAPRYRMGQRTMRELMVRALGRAAYPLAVRSAPTAGATTAAMVVGTATHYQLSVPRGGAVVRFSAPGGGSFPAATGAQLGVLRISP